MALLERRQSYAHQRETTGSMSGSLQFRPFVLLRVVLRGMENHDYHIRWPPLNVTIFITHVCNGVMGATPTMAIATRSIKSLLNRVNGCLYFAYISGLLLGKGCPIGSCLWCSEVFLSLSRVVQVWYLKVYRFLIVAASYYFIRVVYYTRVNATASRNINISLSSIS